MQVPETPLPLRPQDLLEEGKRLVAYPGEPSEMVLHLYNQSPTQTLHNLKIQVEGDFPAYWCRLGTEGRELLPQKQMDAVLYFQIPATFFEDDARSHAPLNADYTCRLTITYREGNDTQIICEQFPFHVRPRSLYLNYLPQLYREVDFIGRFLKVFEETFEPAVQIMDTLWAYLDPLTAPEAMLPFLAHWVAWPVEFHWPLVQQRRLIRHALEIYRWRGTRRGLRFYLHLYTGLPLDEDLPEAAKHISIVEPTGQGFVLAQARLGEGALLGGGRPYHFIVHLRGASQVDEGLVRQILDQEKPAFCTYELYIDGLTSLPASAL
ncbi:phage tail protein [Anthocerotibacter panamensis]|uniref:phage tail protein n=1 Tax=Anthocerotibacter panamensis TaxID=2857077 RepID=UPI0036F1E094